MNRSTLTRVREFREHMKGYRFRRRSARSRNLTLPNPVPIESAFYNQGEFDMVFQSSENGMEIWLYCKGPSDHQFTLEDIRDALKGTAIVGWNTSNLQKPKSKLQILGDRLSADEVCAKESPSSLLSPFSSFLPASWKIGQGEKSDCRNAQQNAMQEKQIYDIDYGPAPVKNSPRSGAAQVISQ